jgi:glycosyltransferase involved in cell wall biosynthesis
VERLQRDGHHVAINCNYGIYGTTTDYDGIPVYPMGMDPYSNDTVQPNWKMWTQQHPGPAIAICLFDAWTMEEKAWADIPTAVWTMVDHLPVPPNVLGTLQRPNITPIAVTRFGQEQIERAGLEALYIPMAIEPSLYYPGATFNGKTGREMIGWDDDVFVVGCINANKAAGGGTIHRKAWAENILAFSIFAQNKPDVRLYLHTERYGRHNGLILDLLLKACGLEEHRHYKVVNQHAYHNGIPNEAMGAIYNGIDVLLAPTLGEGFGLTVLEAQLAGTVAIVNNFSAQPELLGDGWLTEGQPFWDGAQFSWFSTPNVPSIVDCLEQAYARGRERSDKARTHALEYDADKVWDEYWRPYLATVANQKDIDLPQPSRSWTLNPGATDPRLTIYIPTYKRESLLTLLASIAPQLTPDVEVIISDDDPSGQYAQRINDLLADAPCRVEYQHHGINLGGDPNIFRGLEQGSGPWVWLIGDDDELLPGAVANVLDAIDANDVDRIILLTQEVTTSARGLKGDLAIIHQHDPGLLIAATLITANVVRRDKLDLAKGRERLAFLYGHSWANTPCERVRVLAESAFIVGAANAEDFISRGEPQQNVAMALAEWALLVEKGYGLPFDMSKTWNFVLAANAART